MTDALRALRFIQISNPEDTPGTAEAAQEILLGTLTPPADDILINMPEGEERNSLAAFHGDAFEQGLLATMQYNGDVNFRHMTWWLSMAIRGNVTPTQPDSTNQPNTYQWSFTPALTVANTPDQTDGIDVFTIEYGDNMQAYETEYCFATRLQISGAPNEPCRIQVDITGRQKTDTTKTAALTVQSVQRAPFNLTKYFRDATWAGLGTTQKLGCLKGFTWTFETMFTPRFTGDGALFFTSVDEDAKSPELRLILVRGTESDALRTAYEDQTVVFITVRMIGATVLDAGQNNPPYCGLSGGYQIASWPAYGDDQGMATVEVPLRGVYDSTGAQIMRVLLRNSLAAYPT